MNTHPAESYRAAQALDVVDALIERIDEPAAVPASRADARSREADQTAYKELESRILERTATVGVVGLGYVGLPLIHSFIEAGYDTMGFDTDPGKVAHLRSGESYIRHIPAGWIKSAVEAGKFIPTADMQRLNDADVILICVPTPLNENRDPDLAYVMTAARSVAAGLRPGQLVVLESTTYPGTTRDVLLPVLEGAGLQVGRDFFLSYSPEREDPGNPHFSSSQIPKVVGGIDEASLELARDLYRQVFIEVVPVESVEIAEVCKILENTYRCVNIALVNELKILLDRMGIDVWKVIEASGTKPFGFKPFYPGPGLGGHCIPIDPFYLSWTARRHGMSTRFIELAGDINTQMPDYVVSRLVEALNEQQKSVKGSRVCILGVAYKRDVDDPRESPAFAVMERLEALGAEVSYSDPYVPALPRMHPHEAPPKQSTPLTRKFLVGQDCLLILTDHSCVDYEFVVQHAALVVDTRNATRDVKLGRKKIYKA